ncbi:hypothetical protein A2567_02280 [Candidatus Azambacteria bacterium RIFOXYD1_FULL_42_11]|uniref:DUF5671 domain-containing protein n=4 Tax=Candidatus Azamiibacteriota TaxID=1752741 RepID=A0A0G0Z9X7_9BACT|nr:MAG: hypothetical protein UV07_C0022G0012 [Candidatus Azambacteria bacterium GW2011_GWB1_42_17]KKS45449.1 MAG: hypothetical protein UV10_C0024G0003 [Candidatus Azambacteria bacterium GW2011_GWA1_42_19]KKS75492.1 MAG: hypothetical protein UV48_C0011G0013 [Candidatus Azambacteria bacterium GW2011_GWA2_42_9]KKS88396.1 MAG: hypothetical protein UV62_C0008G0015 [Parcubacteria group bacterium GW2011_GWC1_43_11]OGD43296.1 MAG: hypothetical protein A2567_02280 [Candidatus Azambacteria bacterium RIFO
MIKAEPKDVFLHFLAIIALYASTAAFLVLLFQYINVLIPDLLERGLYQLQNYYGSIRWSISSLIIIFPVYVWAGYYLNKIYSREPEKRNLRIRKWLLNFTVFAAALIIIGDLVTLIYNFLGGDLTMRFVLKIAAVFFVAASVFFYYFWELRGWATRSTSSGLKISDSARKIFIYAVIAIVALAVIAGFFVVGSPQSERLRRFDDQKVSDLQIIQGQIIYYWQNKEKLPGKLDDLKDPISGFNPAKDPQTGADYIYEVKGKLEFSLCADFNLPSLESGKPSIELPTYPPQYYPRSDSNWNHGTGYVCFERKIDPELYRPIQKAK